MNPPDSPRTSRQSDENDIPATSRPFDRFARRPLLRMIGTASALGLTLPVGIQNVRAEHETDPCPVTIDFNRSNVARVFGVEEAGITSLTVFYADSDGTNRKHEGIDPTTNGQYGDVPLRVRYAKGADMTVIQLGRKQTALRRVVTIGPDCRSAKTNPHGSAAGENADPTADFEWTPDPSRTGEPVTFTSTATDFDGELVHHGWDFDEDGTEDATGDEVTHTFDSPGEFAITHTVIDDFDASDSITKSVLVNEPPTADFEWTPESGEIGEPITFTSTATDSDGELVHHGWDFDGDGTEDATGGEVTHAFDSPGEFAVTHTVTDDAGASDSVTKSIAVLPWKQTAQLVGHDTETGDDIGKSVAIDGDTAIVGDPAEDENGGNAGAAYVFVRSGETWSEQQKLLADDGAGSDNFGESVDIDGDTVIVGAPRKSGVGFDEGAAYVFTQSGTSWTQQQKFTADNHDRAHFGASVTMVGDTAVVGAPLEGLTSTGIERGAAYVFTRSGASWSQQQKITADTPSDEDSFGNAVAVDGDTALVGAGRESSISGTGEAHVFTRSGTSWTHQQKLLGTDIRSQDHFGWSVELDGDTALVGSRPDSESRPGAGYVFTRSGGTWTQQAKLLSEDRQNGDRFGVAVAIDGNVAVVGARREDENGVDAGAAYVFTRSGGAWSQEQKLLADDGEGLDNFGSSVDLDGETLLVGAYPSHSGAEDAGGAYVFVDTR